MPPSQKHIRAPWPKAADGTPHTAPSHGLEPMLTFGIKVPAQVRLTRCRRRARPWYRRSSRSSRRRRAVRREVAALRIPGVPPPQAANQAHAREHIATVARHVSITFRVSKGLTDRQLVSPSTLTPSPKSSLPTTPPYPLPPPTSSAIPPWPRPAPYTPPHHLAARPVARHGGSWTRSRKTPRRAPEIFTTSSRR